MSNDATAFSEAAPAKINLYLHIVGRRPDGMHLIESLVTFADIGDVVTVSPATDISLTRSGPMADDLPPVEDDLVFRAAYLLAERAGVNAGAAIHVEKNIPVASGIGGGSADAAAAIRALLQLWRIEPTPDQLLLLAQTLGADVLACLASQPAIVAGTGEILSPLGALAPLHAVLVNPRLAVSTAEAFAAFDADTKLLDSDPNTSQAWSSDTLRLVEQLAVRRNDLTAAAQSLCPAIVDILARIGAPPECLLARMCGSGATCFGLFASPTAAHDAAAALQGDNPDWWVAATRLDPHTS